MSNNLHALIRYNAIDGCLQSMHRYSIEDLMSACGEAIAEKTNYRSTGISERAVRGDLSVMRSDKLGFNAPIACYRGKYFYTVENYSIFKKPLQFKKLKLITAVVNKLRLINEFENDAGVKSLTEKLESWLIEEEQQQLKQLAYEENIKTNYGGNAHIQTVRHIPDKQIVLNDVNNLRAADNYWSSLQHQ